MALDETPFRTYVVHQDGSVVVRVAGELDLATAPALRRAVANIISPHLREITLDLGEVAFVDVAGLHALVDISDMVAAPGVDFELSAVTDLTLRVIRLARFEELEAAVVAA